MSVIQFLTCIFLAMAFVKGEVRNPCFRYREVSDWGSTHEVYHRAGGLMYDGSEEQSDCSNPPLEEKWYRPRMKHALDMSTSCPDRVKCGSVHPAWMAGKVPSEDDGIVNRTVCRRSMDDCCANQWEIQVKNCGDFRVYRLGPVDLCTAAYCFGSLAVKVDHFWDHTIIAAAGGVFVFSLILVAITCVYRYRAIRRLRDKWAMERIERRTREDERRNPYLIHSGDFPKARPLFFVTASAPPDKFPTTPRAWEKLPPIETTVTK